MPLFDIKCTSCGEVIEDVIIKDYPKSGYFSDQGKEYRCICNDIYFEILAPLTSMQPDSMWAGKQTDLGYFTSKKDYKDHIKNNNLERATRENYESVQKKKANRLETIKAKNKEKLTKFIEKELCSVEISNDGNTVKEINKYNKVRQ